jgi:hypothetical protein
MKLEKTKKDRDSSSKGETVAGDENTTQDYTERNFSPQLKLKTAKGFENINCGNQNPVAGEKPGEPPAINWNNAKGKCVIAATLFMNQGRKKTNELYELFFDVGEAVSLTETQISFSMVDQQYNNNL